MTQIGARVVGLLVDAVSGILCVAQEVMQPIPDVASDAARIFIKGIVAVDGRAGLCLT
jgi:purine-binding chemotaxis protein CheW